jgi:hypothetical protein
VYLGPATNASAYTHDLEEVPSALTALTSLVLTAGPVLAIFTGWAIFFTIRRIATQRDARRQAIDWDALIASIRLRLPPGAEMVVLEHDVYFYDVRNREAAAEIFRKNSFEVSTTETHTKRARYWLRAVRPAMIDRIPYELQTVFGFVNSYGGRYEGMSSRT